MFREAKSTCGRSSFNVSQADTFHFLLIGGCVSPRQLHLSTSPGRTLSHCSSCPVCGWFPRPPTRGWAPKKEGRCTSPAGSPYSLSHGEGQLEVLLPLRGAQGAVVEGIREEGVHQGTEGHPITPAGGEVLQVHVLRARRGPHRKVRVQPPPTSAPPPSSIPQADSPSPSPRSTIHPAQP